MDTLYGTASIVETLTCLSPPRAPTPGSVGLLESALTFTDILNFFKCIPLSTESSFSFGALLWCQSLQ